MVEEKPDSVAVDSAESGVQDEPAVEGTARGKRSRRLQVSVSLRGLAIAVVIVVLVGAVGVLAWLYVGVQRKLDEQAHLSAEKTHAEDVALHYAVEAAAINYEHFKEWKDKLVAGTSPELKEKLSKAGTSMEQILVPLQWNSTARPLAAKVRSVAGKTYVVDAFVSVLTKTMQAPDPLQSTASYSVTIDSGNHWQITDVGGVGDTLGEK